MAQPAHAAGSLGVWPVFQPRAPDKQDVVMEDGLIGGASLKPATFKSDLEEVKLSTPGHVRADSVQSGSVSEASTPTLSTHGAVPSDGAPPVKRARGRPARKPHQMAIKAAVQGAAAEDFKVKGRKKAPAITAATSRPKRNSLAGAGPSSDPRTPEPSEQSQAASAPLASASTPLGQTPPVEVPKVIRPAFARSLEIFNRPPSPGVTDMLRTLARRPQLSTRRSSSTGGQQLVSSISQGSANAEASGSGSGATPHTPVKSLRSTRGAGAQGYDMSVYNSPSNGLAPISTIASLSGSPYVRKTIKLGSKKGKGKAVEEHVSNQDFCASCGGIGTFLCCDGCPRSFHFLCLDPPLTPDQLPEEDDWYCNECRMTKTTHRRQPLAKGPLGLLIRDIESQIPTQFALPPEIRNAFTGVTTRPDGSYADGVDNRPIKFDRNGVPEERDLYRLRNKGKVPLCFRCKSSAAPRTPSGAATSQHARKLIPCDYCDLYWHMDCVEPPMAVPPSSARKWQCPNHAQQVAPKRRTLRQGVEEITIRRPGHRNNGNIEVIGDEIRKSVDFESVYINSKRYKVPEKVIHLDFWAKIGAKRQRLATSSRSQPTARTLFGSQSPLSTAPSSFTDSEPSSPVLAADTGFNASGKSRTDIDMDDGDGLAHLLLSFSNPHADFSGAGKKLDSALATNGHQAETSDVDRTLDASTSSPLGHYAEGAEITGTSDDTRINAAKAPLTSTFAPSSADGIPLNGSQGSSERTAAKVMEAAALPAPPQTPLRVKLKNPSASRAGTPPSGANGVLANGSPAASPKVVLRMHRPTSLQAADTQLGQTAAPGDGDAQ